MLPCPLTGTCAKPFLRRLLTRLISLVPAVVVAVAVGREGINSLLVVSQVTLSIVLPFVAFPLIYLTSSEVVMCVQKPPTLLPPAEAKPVERDGASVHEVEGGVAEKTLAAKTVKPSIAAAIKGTVDFSNGRVLSVVAYTIWSIIVMANAYALVTLGMQKT